jgi:DNA-binding transcriptional LysR family regulator
MKNLNRIHLNGLRAVEAVGRQHSLQAAAEELGVSPSAVSQQVNRTEKQLGRVLFQRTRSGLAPSEFGAAFLARLTSAFRELSQAVALADDAATNTLIVSSVPSFAARWLVPKLSAFNARHPDIHLRIESSTRVVDFDNSDVDVGFRMGRGNWDGAKAELLLPSTMSPVCTPAIAAEVKEPRDLARFPIIGDQGTMFAWDLWLERAEIAGTKLRPGVIFADPMLCVEAAIAGQGVMLAWPLLVADTLATGRLVRPFAITVGTGLGYYMATSASRGADPKLAVFRKWVMEEVKRTAAEIGSG